MDTNTLAISDRSLITGLRRSFYRNDQSMIPLPPLLLLSEFHPGPHQVAYDPLIAFCGFLQRDRYSNRANWSGPTNELSLNA